MGGKIENKERKSVGLRRKKRERREKVRVLTQGGVQRGVQGDVQRRCSKEVFKGDVQRGCSKEMFKEGVQRGCSKEVFVFLLGRKEGVIEIVIKM